jgi:phosphoribosylamine---glycine ligase
MSRFRRILVVGKDARTDAIAAACRLSGSAIELFALSELLIPGLLAKCREVRIGSLTDIAWLAEETRAIAPDLVIVGPEEPLEAGYVDCCQAMGVPVFGPSQELAAIESSKSWARWLLDRHDIPGNPKYKSFETTEGMRAYMEELSEFVVKPDGLTAGKGVRVLGEHMKSVDDAFQYSSEVLDQHPRVQIEERLIGEEFSLQTITDGESVIHCPLVQDHKRAYEGDQGPNTGGMGSYSCADFSLPFLADADVLQAHTISEKVIDALRRETGQPYRGVLYGGFIATVDGVRLIEYNARFGDPEAMNVIPILDADFVELCGAVATGGLSNVPWSFRHKATVCKYVVPEDYPSKSPRTKLEIGDELRQTDHLAWFWAASEQSDGDVFMTSSRTGAFVGIGDSLSEAEAEAEGAASALKKKCPIRYRQDIGTEALVRKRIEHMEALRGSPRRSPVDA